MFDADLTALEGAAREVLARSYLSRALGLAESLEHPIAHPPTEDAVRAIASEIAVLIRASTEALGFGEVT